MKVCPTCSNQWPDDQKFCPNDGSALRSAAGTADLVGSVIGGNYHIKKKLGEGGMGAVYLGEHVKMSRKSAIKVMTQSMAHDPDAIARFNREATNAARINHPNVCGIYDFGESDGLIFLAMEFIEGGSLTSIIEEVGALPPQRAASILLQTGEALQAAHDLGIVHRDLKPDNIMITKGRGGADLVKVVDFGIAKAMGGEEGQKVTKTGLVVGTPEYMSPEQLSGDALDGRSDIYSLALVFFRMITGTLPFQADSAQETMIKRLTDDPLKLAEAMPGTEFPPRLQQVMDRALARMPADRYASASEFAHDVVSAVKGMAVTDAPAGDGATQIIGAHDARTAALPSTRVTNRTGAKTAVNTPPTPQPQTSVQRPVAQKKTPVGIIAAVVLVLVGGGGAAAVLLNGGAPEAGKSGSVSPDTASKTAGGNTSAANRTPPRDTSPRGTPRPGGTPPKPDSTKQVAALNAGGNSPAPAVADTAVVSAQLEAILNDLDGRDKVAANRPKATAIYLNTRVVAEQRAEAASLVGLAYQYEENKNEACRWFDNALALRPNWNTYLKQKNREGCS